MFKWDVEKIPKKYNEIKIISKLFDIKRKYKLMSFSIKIMIKIIKSLSIKTKEETYVIIVIVSKFMGEYYFRSIREIAELCQNNIVFNLEFDILKRMDYNVFKYINIWI